MFHHKWLDIVPSATQQGPMVNPSRMQHSASIYPKLPVHLTPSPSPTSLFSKSMIFFSMETVYLCCILDARYEWYHMVFIFLFLTYFTQYEPLVPTMLLQMALCHSFLWPSSIPLCIYTTSSESSHLLMDIWVVSMSWLSSLSPKFNNEHFASLFHSHFPNCLPPPCPCKAF